MSAAVFGRHPTYFATGVCTLHEMVDARGALKEANRILRPGGEILIVDFPRGSLAQRLWNEDDYDPNEVACTLQQGGFNEVRATTIERGQVI